MISVREMTHLDQDAYQDFLEKTESALIYQSLGYKGFLDDLLTDSTSTYLLGFQDGRLEGVMPFFAKRTSAGTVFNSLPFFGGHGGPLVTAQNTKLTTALLDEFYSKAEEEGAISATIVEPLFGNRQDILHFAKSDLVDHRIGQVNRLPQASSKEKAIEVVMSRMHQKSRNSLRKGLKSGFHIRRRTNRASFRELELLHQENMLAIGGTAKSRAVFNALASNLTPGQDYAIYEALDEQKCIAASLLVLYFKKTVEYFVPASTQVHRATQPLSVLILEAMVDAIVERGSTIWNWGGTWATQDGVYRFKSRWGAEDIPYHYRINFPHGIGRLRDVGLEKLHANFEYFYTCPYDILKR